jgi:hypothetical protein
MLKRANHLPTKAPAVKQVQSLVSSHHNHIIHQSENVRNMCVKTSIRLKKSAALMYDNYSTVSQKIHRGVLLSTMCHCKISSSCGTIVSQNYIGITLCCLSIYFSLLFVGGVWCGVWYLSLFCLSHLFTSSFFFSFSYYYFLLLSSFPWKGVGEVCYVVHLCLFLCVFLYFFSVFLLCVYMSVSFSMVALVFSQQLWVFGSFC